MASPKAPLLDGAGKKSKDVTLEAEVFGVDRVDAQAELRAALAAHGSQTPRGASNGAKPPLSLFFRVVPPIWTRLQ